MTHTPGPWHVEDKRYILPKEELNGLYVIAEAYGPDEQANAHLIAAAPDMLAALKELLAGYTSEKAEYTRAAIAKAEGKS